MTDQVNIFHLLVQRVFSRLLEAFIPQAGRKESLLLLLKGNHFKKAAHRKKIE